MITECPGSDSPAELFTSDTVWEEYLPYGTCVTCGVPIMLICAPDCQGSHDYLDEPACTRIIAKHSRTEG